MNLLLAPIVISLLGSSFPGNQLPTRGKEQIRVMPVAATPEPYTVNLAIQIPKDGQPLSGNPIWVQLRLDGYSLGAASQFERADDIAVSNMGQTARVVVDNDPFFAINEPAIDPFYEDGFYYDMSYKFEVPYRLKEGMHTLRVFEARSFGESLKGNNTFRAISFYVGSQEEKSGMDLSAPYITYNEPSGQMDLKEDQPVLLDFWVSNTELSADGYKVRLTVDGKIKRNLTSWQPYYIYGLKRGSHTVRLELINPQGTRVPGLFNDTERTIQVR